MKFLPKSLKSYQKEQTGLLGRIPDGNRLEARKTTIVIIISTLALAIAIISLAVR